jgi:hypothetical protein
MKQIRLLNWAAMVIVIPALLLIQSCDDATSSSGTDTEESVSNDEVTEPTNKESVAETVSTGSNIKDMICSEAGYVWENISTEADIYTAISFNGDEFKMASYNMKGSQNPQEFTRVVDFAGVWETISDREIEGTISGTNTKVEWTFNEDYSSMINNKGITFRKVGVN